MANISIHALREEGDVNLVTADFKAMDFYPRPPRGGRPSGAIPSIAPRMISIHALREEGDPYPLGLTDQQQNFYPRPPRGGRQNLFSL